MRRAFAACPLAPGGSFNDSHAVLNHQQSGKAPSSQPGLDRFIASIAGALGDLKILLLDSPWPIDPGTGAQIAQMLRAIREAASSYELDRIARTAADIEMYLLSSEAYGPGATRRNFILGSKIDDLSRQIGEAVRPD